MKAQKHLGFTLIELTTVVLVAGVILGIGVPAFNQFTATSRMTAGANDLVAAIHLARTEAVKRRANVTICPSANPSADVPRCDRSGDFADGWIVFVDCTLAAPPVGKCGAPNYTVADDRDVLSIHDALTDDLAENFTTLARTNQVNGVPGYVTYSATGFPRNIPALGGIGPVSDFELCDQRGNMDVGGGIAAGRWIQITPTGRPEIHREVAEIQGTENLLAGC